MIEPKYIELINKEVDGLNSSRDSVILAEYLKKSSEAQNLYENLVKLSETLDQTEKIDPSPNLKKTILNSINMGKYSSDQNKSWSKSILSHSNVRIKYAFMFAAGMILGIIGYSIISDTLPKIDTSNLNGTFMIDNNSETLKTIDRFEFDSSGINCLFNIKSGEKQFLAEVDLKSDRLIRIKMEYDRENIIFQNIQKTNDNYIDMVVKSNYFELNHEGNGNYLIFLRRSLPVSASIDLKIFSNDTLLFERNLTILSTKQ